MEKEVNIKNKVEVEWAIEKLSNEEQIALLKKLIWKTLAHEYIERKTDAFARGVGFSSKNDEITEEDIEKYRDTLVNKTGKAVYSMVDTMLGDDDELKYRVFEKFIERYRGTEKEAREEICKYQHDFNDWETKEGRRPVFDEDGDVEGQCWGKYYKRTCKYCGTYQIAYSEGHKVKIEGDTNYNAEHYKRVLIYTKENIKK